MIQEKSNKIVLFDIDHTIFDTILYRTNLYKNLAIEIGVEINEFSQTARHSYENLRKNTYYLDPTVFLNTILNLSKKSADIKKLEDVFWDKRLYESCVYPDVKETFSYLKKKNITIGIFSTGDPKHQKIKIESLKEYLTEGHIYISPDKFKIIKNTFDLYKKYQTFLVEDFPQVLESAKAHNKDIFTVFIKRQKSHHHLIIPDNFAPDATITSLTQLIDIIENDN